MTKQEAWTEFPIAINRLLDNPCSINARYLIDVLNKLKPALPEPDTGLVPCGCGGMAELHPAGGVGNNDVMAECSTCSMAVICETKEEAIRVWNEAMGYKEDEA